MEFMLSYFFVSVFFNSLGTYMTYKTAAFAAFALIVMIPVLTVLVVLLANRQHRFAAVTPKGVVVRNLRNQDFVAFDDISIVALRDTPPWIKHRGIDRLIVLKGLCDTEDELKIFEEAISRARSKDSQTEPTSPPFGRSAVSSSTNSSPDHNPAQPSKSKKRRGFIATITGLTLLGTGIFILIVSALILPNHLSKIYQNIGVCMFWIGVVLALIGQWQSDPRHD